MLYNLLNLGIERTPKSKGRNFTAFSIPFRRLKCFRFSGDVG